MRKKKCRSVRNDAIFVKNSMPSSPPCECEREREKNGREKGVSTSREK